MLTTAQRGMMSLTLTFILPLALYVLCCALNSKMALQEVITKWKAELEEDVLNYQKQSERVKQWDTQLRENQKVLV